MKIQPAMVEIVVADMPAALAFYRLLGLDIPAEADSEVHVVADFGGTKIGFDTDAIVTSYDSAWSKPAPKGHRVALAFSAGSPAEVDQAYEEITAAGYAGHLEPFDAPWGMRYAVVHDPDDNPVDIFADLS
jgi:catechol 2,3-dioxygenase-like lactoylglutathione lyase family enzyme